MTQHPGVRCLMAALAITSLFASRAATAQTPPDEPTRALLQRPAVMQVRPENGLLLAAATAGKRLVAAGANGVVLLSDDGGQSFRQARVPVQLQLNALHFVDERSGFAVGHAGVILSTRDGGESWSVQRISFESDQPLFSVYFRNAQEGWAVGLWSSMLHTTDGGATWSAVTLPVPPGQKKADLNLFRMFGQGDSLFVACERGLVLRSTNAGQNWEYSNTGYAGSLWAGAAWPDGSVLVGGLRGSLFRSGDGGRTWQRVKTNSSSSITAIARSGPNARAVGLDGLVLDSQDQGATFAATGRDDRRSFTALAGRADGGWFQVSKSGVR